MKTYKAEKEIAGLLKDKTTAALSVKIDIPKDQDQFVEKARASFDKITNKKILKALSELEEYEHPDLMYGSAIMVSTVMNRNDDVFLPEEVWAARNSPVNTPYNEEHEEMDIIGHIIASRVLDESGEVYLGEEPPAYCDLEVDIVIYKSIFPSIARAIAENAPQNKQFVSMECKFTDFAYAIFENDGEAKIVARNEKTAFLTKYLRAYGGNGVYNNKRIGRVLKNIRFTGMGNVKVPANPDSEYTRIDGYELASANFKNEDFIFQTKGSTMVIETLDQAKQVIDSLNKDLETAKSNASTIESQLTQVKGEQKTLDEKLTAESAKVKLANEEIEKAVKAQADLQATIDSLKAELETKNKELNEIQVAKLKESRVNQLKTVGLEFAADELEKMYSMSDDAFAAMLFALAAMKKKAKSKDGDMKDGEMKEDCKADSKTEELEKAKASEDNTLENVANTAGAEPTPEEKQKELASLAKAVLGKLKPRKAFDKNVKA